MKFLILVACLSVSLWACSQNQQLLGNLIEQAERGNADAQLDLADRYHAGTSVPSDYVEAVKWYRLAAEQGDTDAQTSLAAMYDAGEGAPQDYAEAFKWRRLAAEQGHVLAQYNVSFHYVNGRGVSQDYVRAHMWRNLAAARVASVGQSRFPDDETRDSAANDFAQARDAVAASMTPDQIAEAQRLAREWKPKTWEEMKPE